VSGAAGSSLEEVRSGFFEGTLVIGDCVDPSGVAGNGRSAGGGPFYIHINHSSKSREFQ
jgi:hypothetical protein